jgi:hypothetical protein
MAAIVPSNQLLEYYLLPNASRGETDFAVPIALDSLELDLLLTASVVSILVGTTKLTHFV